MKTLARFSLANRSLITLLAIVSAVFGIVALQSMRQDLVPTIASSSVSIVTTYDDATPAVVDSEVSQVVETIIESVDGLVSTTTYSGNGLSLVTGEFELGLDTEQVMQEVSKKLAENSSLLPSSVRPQVDGASVDDFPVVQFALGTGDTALTTSLQDSVTQRLEGVSGVREARFTGIPSDQVTVQLDQQRSDETGIGVRDLQSAIVSGGTVSAAGSLTEGERTFNVQTGRAVATPDDIKALPITAPKTGDVLTVGDVADVQHRVPGASLISRVDGEPTVMLLISKIPNANTVDLSTKVQAEMSDIDAEYDLNSSLIFDQSPYIQRSVETLATEGLIGLLCAVIVVFFFLTSIRSTLVTAVSIPTSLLLAAVVMNFADFTINMITLAALTVAVGRVVDDSIVVVESIEREMLVTNDRVAAIINGVSTVAGAVLSSTLTTVAVFLPIAFIGGTIGELFRPFALTAAAALLASLVISLTIVPVLAFWFVHPRPLSGDASRFDERVRTRIDQMYRPLISGALAHPWRIVSFSLVVLIGSALLLPGISTGYLSALGDTQIRVLEKLDPGTSLDAQKTKADVIEKALIGVDGVDRVQTSIRSSGSVIQDASLGGGDGLASFVLTTGDGTDQTTMIDEVRSTLESLPEYESLGELDYSITTDMDFAAGIEIGVSALDDASLSEAVTSVTEQIEGLDVVADTESTLANTVERLEVHVDGAKAIEYGLTDQEVRDAVHDALSSTDAGSMVMDGKTMNITVLPGRTVASTADLSSVPISTPLEGDQPLSTFASIENVRGPIVLQSQRGLRYAVVTVEPRTDDLGATADALQTAIDDADLPEGATVDLGGSVTARVDAFEQMGTVSLIAILIVYTIMVATFRSLVQPLLLLVAIPFAVTGGAIIQRVTGEPVGVPSLIGCLMLVGIVVTNSIVLIDLVNQRRAAGIPLREAVVEGTTRRIRPILMTAAATVFALIPMAVGLTSSSAFISRPLGLVVIGGMVSSTLLTLVVLPVLYFLLERWRERRRDSRADSGRDDTPRYRRTAPSDEPRQPGTVHAVRPASVRASDDSRGADRGRPRSTPRRRPAPRAPWRAPVGSGDTRATRATRRIVLTGKHPDVQPQPAHGPERPHAEAPTRAVPFDPPTPLPADVERTTRLAPPSPTDIPSRAWSRPVVTTEPSPLIRVTTTDADPSPARGSQGRLLSVDESSPLRRRRDPRSPLPQYVAFSQATERTSAATLNTWWTTGPAGRRPLLMIDPFIPHETTGLGIAEPVDGLEFSGSRLDPHQFELVGRLSRLLREDLHGYSYFAAQLVLWEVLGPAVTPAVDVRVPADDAEAVGREFERLYERLLHEDSSADGTIWVLTPTAPSEPRMLVGGLGDVHGRP